MLRFVCVLLAWGTVYAAESPLDPQMVARGRTAFQSSCGFCHGNDAAGNRAPDLIRSATLTHDDHGDLLGPVIRNGRPEKGMPAFANLSEPTVSDIVTFLHNQLKTASNSARVPRDYPLAKLLTGDARRGETYFNGAGGCSACHSPAKDLKGIAKKYSPVDLQQSLVYPKTRLPVTATVRAKGAAYDGTLRSEDEFVVAITTNDGTYHSWPRGEVEVEVHDPLRTHRELTQRLSDRDMHDLFAYLETLE